MLSNSVQEITIQSGSSNIKGRLYIAQTNAIMPTAIIVPGWPGNPEDILGLGAFLSDRGVNALIFSPRGHYESGGESTFANTLEDIASVIDWARTNEGGYPIQRDLLFLGGYSFGGGMALAYASMDPTIKWIFSIAGTDHAQLIRHCQEDEEFAEFLVEILSETAAPKGPVRFDVQATLSELSEGQDIFGLRENAANLAGREILLIGGWEDENVTIEESLLPLYRELKKNLDGEVIFKVFHDDHEFAEVREEMSEAILTWIRSKTASA
jgi:dienelactone hydrolase